MFLLAQNTSALGRLFGWFINILFDLVYSISPAYSLFITVVLFTILVKLLLFPLMVKQQKSMKATQAIQPEIQRIQDKYKNKNDAESQQQMAMELQAVYKGNNASPFTGCLLSFIQIPIIYALFGVCKQIHIHIAKIGDIYNSLSTMIMKVPGSNELLSNLATAKKLTAKQTFDFNIIDDVKSLFITLSNNDWSALLNDISSHVDVNAINELLIKKNEIETAFGINLINRPSIHNFSVILPLLTVLVTYLSIRKSLKQTKDMDEQSAKMMKNMSTFMYVMIVSIFFTSLSLPTALSIYWTLNSLIGLVQNAILKKMFSDKKDDKKDDFIDVKKTKKVE